MTVIGSRFGVWVVSAAMLAASLTGCESGSRGSCTGAEIDYAATAHGQATPSEALAALLDKRPHGLPATGWQRHSSAKDQVVFRSGSSRISVFQVADTSWLVDSYTFCG
jgi:hypothetical protein